MTLVDENVLKESENINGVGKILLIKTSVSILAILSIVEGFVAEFGGGYRALGDNSSHMEEATKRAYCKDSLASSVTILISDFSNVLLYSIGALMLLIFDFQAILAMPVFFQKMTPNNSTYNRYKEESFTFCRYLSEVFRLFDIRGLLDYTEYEPPVNEKVSAEA